MNFLEELKFKIFGGYSCNKKDIINILNQPIDLLCESSNDIRYFFCKDKFDICSIINGKSGNCTENCKFCAQSSHYNTSIKEYSLLNTEELLNNIIHNSNQGITHLGIVTSGKILNLEDFNKICTSYNFIFDRWKINLCASHGLLSFEQLKKLKQLGITRYHNNIETSRAYFPKICTTHSYDDKINVIKNAQKAGLKVCSGIIIGLGETFEDRIEMAFELKNLGIKSIPVNILNPIKGTPFENNNIPSYEDILRTIAILRFINPDSFIRLAGGRSLIKDKGKKAFLSGANATISGDMLTTNGFNTKTDIKLVKSLGYQNII